MCSAFLFLFFGKQPLCKPREDYTLFCLELSQELFTFTEIRSCQPAGLTFSLYTPRPSALLLCPHGPTLESTFPSLPRFNPPAKAHLFKCSLWLLIPLSPYYACSLCYWDLIIHHQVVWLHSCLFLLLNEAVAAKGT